MATCSTDDARHFDMITLFRNCQPACSVSVARFISLHMEIAQHGRVSQLQSVVCIGSSRSGVVVALDYKNYCCIFNA